MCANCVAQGAVYVGGAVGALRTLAWRAGRRRSVAGHLGEPLPNRRADGVGVREGHGSFDTGGDISGEADVGTKRLR
jgi:hypothetical protein